MHAGQVLVYLRVHFKVCRCARPWKLAVLNYLNFGDFRDSQCDTRTLGFQQVSALQEAGLIVMQLSSAGQPGSTREVYDPQYSHIWVLLNSNPHKVAFEAPAGQPHNFALA